jgi:hypothetical protein
LQKALILVWLLRLLRNVKNASKTVSQRKKKRIAMQHPTNIVNRKSGLTAPTPVGSGDGLGRPSRRYVCEICGHKGRTTKANAGKRKLCPACEREQPAVPRNEREIWSPVMDALLKAACEGSRLATATQYKRGAEITKLCADTMQKINELSRPNEKMKHGG